MWAQVIVVGLVGLVAAYPKRLVLAFGVGVKAVTRIILALRGHTPTSYAEARVVSGQSWDEFCDTLKAAGNAILFPGTPKDPLSQAEGYRYLSRLTRAALENFVECADPSAPRLTSIVDGYRPAPCKLGSDNPDNLYLNAMIDGRRHYKVTGTRGTVPILMFGSQAGSYGQAGGLKTIDCRDVSELELTGRNRDQIEIALGPTNITSAKNFLRTDPDIPDGKGMFIIRQTFMVRSDEEAAKLDIELMDGNEPSQLTCEHLDDALKSAGLLVAGAPIMFAKWASEFKSHTNMLPLFDQQRSNNVGGDPNIRYFHSHWALQPGEALVIEATPPECATWNFQLNNYWMESLDYRYHPIHVNKGTAKYKKDGSIRIVVAAERPAQLDQNTFNWIDTAGHDQGTMSFRWIKPEVTNAPLAMPSTVVTRLAQLN